MALISVIVPVYNVSPYVEQCLESLLEQTFAALDIIVVDDCGTDDSMQKVARLAKRDKRIRMVHNATNQGLAQSRNIGLKHVQTPYVAFLDSDDWVAPDFYEKLYRAITHADADIAVGNVLDYNGQAVYPDGWVGGWNFKTGKTLVSTPAEKQYNIYACACWNKLYKTELFTKYQLEFPKGLYIEDVPITFITAALAQKIALVKEAILYYRKRGDSIMAISKTDRKPFDIFPIYDYTEALLTSCLTGKERKVYRQILENFEIFNLYSWYTAVSTDFKTEFWSSCVSGLDGLIYVPIHL